MRSGDGGLFHLNAEYFAEKRAIEQLGRRRPNFRARQACPSTRDKVLHLDSARDEQELGLLIQAYSHAVASI